MFKFLRKIMGETEVYLSVGSRIPNYPPLNGVPVISAFYNSAYPRPDSTQPEKIDAYFIDRRVLGKEGTLLVRPMRIVGMVADAAVVPPQVIAIEPPELQGKETLLCRGKRLSAREETDVLRALGLLN